MKLYLDDERPTPEGWTAVRTAHECIDLLATGKVTHLSFDHDLGDDSDTGYAVACWIEQKVFSDGFKPPVMEIHSANPVGRANIEACIRSINRILGTRRA